MTLRRRCPLILGPLLAVSLAASVASAQPGLDAPAPPPPAPASVPPAPLPPAPLPAPMEPRIVRYGWQIFAVDMAGLLSIAVAEDGEIFGLTYVFGGAAIHAAHGNGSKALQSIGIRLLGPLAGMLGGAAVADCEYSGDGFCELGYVAAGALLGMTTAAAIDWFILAKKVEYEPAQPAALLRYGRLRANPDLRVTRRGGMTLGFTGSF